MRKFHHKELDMTSLTYQRWLVDQLGDHHKLPLDISTRAELERRYRDRYGRTAMEDYISDLRG